MAASAFVLMTLLGGGYYVSRVAPRVLQRMGTAPAAGAAGAAAQQAVGRYEHAFAKEMSRREALLVLGFEEGAAPAPADIQKRYRAAMATHHADVGGSPFIAQKVNEARDHLTK